MIVTKGYGAKQMIVTQGYGDVAIIILPSACRMLYISAENREFVIV